MSFCHIGLNPEFKKIRETCSVVFLVKKILTIIILVLLIEFSDESLKRNFVNLTMKSVAESSVSQRIFPININENNYLIFLKHSVVVLEGDVVSKDNIVGIK